MTDIKALSEECNQSEIFVGLSVMVVLPTEEEKKKFGHYWDNNLLKYAGGPKPITKRHEVGYHVYNSDYIYPISMLKPCVEAGVVSGKAYGNELPKRDLTTIFTGWTYYTKQNILYFYTASGHKWACPVTTKKPIDLTKSITFENNSLVIVINGKRFFQEEIRRFCEEGQRLLDFAPLS